MNECPEMMDPEEWLDLLEEARQTFAGFTLCMRDDEVFLVTSMFELWWWDPVDGCFMPTERLDAQ